MLLALSLFALAASDPVVATVNGRPVTASDLAAVAAAHPPADGKAYTAEERRALLQELVDTDLLWQEAKARKLDETARVKQVMAAELLRTDAYAAIPPEATAEPALQAWYKAHTRDFVVPESREVYRILLRITDKRDAAATRAELDKLRAQVQPKGANFAALAEAHSQDPSRRRKGSLGWVERGQEGVDPAVVGAAWKLAEDAVSEPFRTAEGWNLVYVARIRAADPRTYEEARADVVKAVRQAEMEKARAAYLARLAAAGKVKVDEAALEAAELPVPGAPARP